MTWHPASNLPTQPKRYPVQFETGTQMMAFWSPEYGWRDGLTKLNHVRWWYDLPLVDLTKRR